MTRLVCRGLVLAIAVLLAACEKSRPSAGSEAKPLPSPVLTASQPFEVITASGVPMVALPGGEFTMGSDKGNEDEAPAHKVKISAFLMDQFEVTHELFKQAQLPNPSHWQDHPKKPVERVRWRDAKQYCNERSLLEGLKPCYNEKTADLDCDFTANGYRLPTEAEWEYACRAGSTADFDFGAPDKLRQFAWFADNGDARTHIVGERKPNRWGLHDLYGNVAEWCEDVYAPTYYKESPATDPLGPPSPGKDVKRVIPPRPEDRRHGRVLFHGLLRLPLRAPRDAGGNRQAGAAQMSVR